MYSKKKRKVQDTGNSDDEIEICGTPESSEKDFRKYFSYEKSANSVKVGICKSCKNRTVIKMKNSNTTRLKRHLMTHHADIYTLLFEKLPVKTFSALALQEQTNLERIVTVSLFLN